MEWGANDNEQPAALFCLLLVLSPKAGLFVSLKGFTVQPLNKPQRSPQADTGISKSLFNIKNVFGEP